MNLKIQSALDCACDHTDDRRRVTDCPGTHSVSVLWEGSSAQCRITVDGDEIRMPMALFLALRDAMNQADR